MSTLLRRLRMLRIRYALRVLGISRSELMALRMARRSSAHGVVQISATSDKPEVMI